MKEHYLIHQYKLNGYNIVIDGNSGSIHSVDEPAYMAIHLLDEGISEKKIYAELIKKFQLEKYEIKELLDDINDMKKEGILFSEDPYEDVASKFKKNQSVLKAICLHVAHGCNMDCEYCFAGKGEYSGKAGIMPLRVGKAALDFLVRESGERKNLEVDFFGGEPLLNWDVCKELVVYGRELEKKHNKKFNFTLTTNGILIDNDVIDFTSKEMCNVVLSLDGRKSVHERMRHSKVSNGEYEKIVDNFSKLVEARERFNKEYYVRGTYTAYNKDFATDVIQMADLGFKETSIEPVVVAEDVDYKLRDDDIDYLCNQYEKLSLEMLKRRKQGKPFNFYHYNIDLNGGPCIYKRVSGCGTGTEYLAVTPIGDLYPCHQFVSDDDFKLGDVFSGITNIKKQNIFREGNNLYTRNECKNCFAKFYCSGGCSANNYHYNGDIDKVHEFSCKLHRKRIECAIMMKVAEQES